MALHTGSLFWPDHGSASHRYPPLTKNSESRVVIIGGGMSGVSCGFALVSSGIDTILIEQGAIASGSTSANTGLIQYANDMMLTELAAAIGIKKAATFYKACKHATERLNNLAQNMPRNVQFKLRSSLYYASSPRDASALRQEYETLRQHDFGVEWWEEEKIAKHFPFRRTAAIVTHGDAEVDPYQFVQHLAYEAVQKGLKICENTAMLRIDPCSEGYRVTTTHGQIEASEIIYAVGYAPEIAGGRWIKPVMNRTYAIATEPIASSADWHERFLLWETARPYLYLRTTADHRILVGGLDENIRHPVITAQELRERSWTLMSELRRLFPGFTPQIRYEWCATFGESSDGLPWIGEDPDRPGQHYALGYGGNGMVYSILGAEIIRDRILRKDNPIGSIVRPDRAGIPQ